MYNTIINQTTIPFEKGFGVVDQPRELIVGHEPALRHHGIGAPKGLLHVECIKRRVGGFQRQVQPCVLGKPGQPRTVVGGAEQPCSPPCKVVQHAGGVVQHSNVDVCLGQRRDAGDAKYKHVLCSGEAGVGKRRVFIPEDGGSGSKATSHETGQVGGTLLQRNCKGGAATRVGVLWARHKQRLFLRKAHA